MNLKQAEHPLKILAGVTAAIAVITVTWVWVVTVKRQNQLATEIVAASNSPTPAPAVMPEEAPSVPVATAAPVAARTPVPTPRPAPVAPVGPAPSIPAAVATSTGPLSTPYGTKARQFRYKNPNAQAVFLAGNFNQWKPQAMKMDSGGTWFIDETLPRGVPIEYQYIVDGARIADPWGAIPSQAADNGTLKSVYTVPITDPTPRPKPSVAATTPTPTPVDSTAPKMTPVPIIAPVPMGGVPESAPATASDAVDLATLASTPGDWPKTVTIKQAAGIVFPIIIDGKVAGQIQATPGMQVSLVKVTPNQLTVSFQGSVQVVPVSSTDLVERVQASRKH